MNAPAPNFFEHDTVPLEQRRICLPVEEFIEVGSSTTDGVEEIANLRMGGHIGSLKISAAVLLDQYSIEGLARYYRNTEGPEWRVLADIGAGTGVTDSIAEIARLSKIFSVSGFDVTLSSLVMPDDIKRIRGGLENQLEGQDIKFLLRGPMPEDNAAQFEETVNRTPTDYVKMLQARADRLSHLGVVGVFASAEFGTENEKLSLGAGVSFDGAPYIGYGGLQKTSVTIQRALATCDQLVLGTSIKSHSEGVSAGFNAAAHLISTNV